MKYVGRIIEYDGWYGKLISDDGKQYVIFKKDVYTTNLTKDDYVTFEKEFLETSTDEIGIARFVKKFSLKID